jgi:beta-phosphoglucomutase-like phosphatase (HAD superfamily)
LALGLGVTDKSQAIVLEDSTAGLLSGRLAGFDVIGFNDGNILKSGMAEETYAMVDGLESVLKCL